MHYISLISALELQFKHEFLILKKGMVIHVEELLYFELFSDHLFNSKYRRHRQKYFFYLMCQAIIYLLSSDYVTILYLVSFCD